MNPEPTKRQSRLLPSGSTPKGRILIVVGGVFILVIAGLIVAGLLGSSGQNSTQTLVSVTAHQQELIRISQLAVTTAKNRDTQNLAITAQLSVTSDQHQLLTRLNRSNVKVTKLQLSSRKNSQTDAQFTQASQANQFDSIFKQSLNDELVSYQKAIKAAYDANSGQSTRALLNTEFKNAGALLGSVPAQSK
jgi:hypothetical protein